MPKREFHPRLAWPQREISCRAGEILDVDDPLAHEIAEPMFQAGVLQLAITDKVAYVHDRLKTHGTHTLHLLLQGEFGVGTGGEVTWLDEGDLAAIPAGISFVTTGKRGVSCRFVYVNIDDTDSWRGLKERGVTVSRYESADYLYLLTRRLLDAQATRDMASIDHAERDSYALVDLLMRETTPASHPEDKTSLALRELVAQIRANPERRWNNEDMARSLHMSERSFLRAFKREFGSPPKTMVMKQRMTLAGQRLAFTDDTIEKISSDLGYADRQTFSELFLKHVGVRPVEFRQKHSS